MMASESKQLKNYSALLKIRQAGKRREVIIAAGIFIVTSVSVIAVGLVRGLGGREAYLVVAGIVIFGMNYLISWVRLEIIKGSIELIDTLQLAME